MKVLFAVPYIYNREYKEFTRNSTGLGIILTEIFTQVSKNNDAYLISNVLTQGHGNILPHTIWNVLRHMRWKDLVQGIQWALRYKQSIPGRLRYLYYCLNKGYIRHTIQKLQPDVVHIHGVGLPCKLYVEVCQELSKKYVITLHGLIGLSDSVRTPKWNKACEKEILIECEEQNVPVTVISSGIKSRIEQHYLGTSSRSITVVPNGTNVEPRNNTQGTDLRKAYHIPEDAMIAVCVGSIYGNKNQIQIVEAMPLVHQKANKDLYVIFCGNDCTNGAVQKRIDELGLTDHAIMLGYVPYEQMSNMYAQADFNILASISEGFGMGIIEAFVYGLPSVTFADLDAIPDLYHEKTMLLCQDRSTEALADAIVQTMDSTWDPNAIMEHSKKFSLEQMAKNYQKVYMNAVQ